MKLTVLISILFSQIALAQNSGLSNYEKARMIPPVLNSMMLFCESQCANKHTFESKNYQKCYHDCLEEKVESNAELNGCNKQAETINCPDGVYKKVSSILDIERNVGKDIKILENHKNNKDTQNSEKE
jgi:hypothetical protein